MQQQPSAETNPEEMANQATSNQIITVTTSQLAENSKDALGMAID